MFNKSSGKTAKILCHFFWLESLVLWGATVSSVLENWFPDQLVQLIKGYVGILDGDLLASKGPKFPAPRFDVSELWWDPELSSTVGALLVAENIISQAFGANGKFVPELARADAKTIEAVQRIAAVMSQPEQTLGTQTA